MGPQSSFYEPDQPPVRDRWGRFISPRNVEEPPTHEPLDDDDDDDWDDDDWDDDE